MLDRPFSKRNDIEKQAIAALAHLANIIVYLIDPSETCGYSVDDQKNLLSQLKKMFKKSFCIVVENKSDMLKTRSKNLKLSCNNNDGIDKLVEKIFTKI